MLRATVLAFAAPTVAQSGDPGPSNPGVFGRELWLRPTADAASLLDEETFAGRPDRSDRVTSPIGFAEPGDDFVQRICFYHFDRNEPVSVTATLCSRAECGHIH